MRWLRLLLYISMLAFNGALAFPQSLETTDTADLEANWAELGGVHWSGILKSPISRLYYITNEYMDNKFVRQIVHLNVLERRTDISSITTRAYKKYSSDILDFETGDFKVSPSFYSTFGSNSTLFSQVPFSETSLPMKPTVHGSTDSLVFNFEVDHGVEAREISIPLEEMRCAVGKLPSGRDAYECEWVNDNPYKNRKIAPYRWVKTVE